MPRRGSLQSQIAQARVEQITRVNGVSTDTQRVADLEQEVARLQERLHTARRLITERDTRIVELEDRVAELELQAATPISVMFRAAERPTAQPPAPIKGRPAPSFICNGRAATTAQLAAEFYGVHLSTIIRRLQSGKIAGTRLKGSNRWAVYLDCPIDKFQKKGKRK